MDILRVLSSPNMDIRKKTLGIAMELITSRNIDEVYAREGFSVFVSVPVVLSGEAWANRHRGTIHLPL